MNYYERHIGDYLKDTAHLSLLEHGVYARLLDVYYTRESGIPQAEAHRLIGARAKDERDAVDAVLAEFFKLVDGVWRQDRCDREIARFQEKQAKARAAADARWSESGRNADASAKHETSADAEPMRTHSEGNATRAPVPRHQTPDTREVSKASPSHPAARGARFAEFWTAWPAGERKQDKAKCLDHWRRNQLDASADTILADVRTKRGTQKWQEGYIEAPLVYLRGKRWEDGVVPAASAAEAQRDASMEAQRKKFDDDAAAARTPESIAAREAVRARVNSIIKRVA